MVTTKVARRGRLEIEIWGVSAITVGVLLGSTRGAIKRHKFHRCSGICLSFLSNASHLVSVF
jgi:hypothetical protein